MATQRKYPLKDVKILYSRAAGRCAVPACRIELVKEGTEHDETKQIGKIAHIVGHSDDGPRGDPKYSRDKLDTYENWILLCPNHHDEYDAQPKTYTTKYLRQIKSDHEHWVRSTLVSEVRNVGFAELEIVTKAILSRELEPSNDYAVVPPKEKMERNGLTNQVHKLLSMGLIKSSEVKNFIQHISIQDSSFPERLKSGFLEEYSRLKQEEIQGDELFNAMHEFSSGGSNDFLEKAAGLAVLSYLFECCEVFEK